MPVRRTKSTAAKKSGTGLKKAPGLGAEAYKHPEAQAVLRPDVGTQAQFRKKKPPKTYRYDSSLSPSLNWDGQNPGREEGEWLLSLIEKAAALKAPHEFPQAQILQRGDERIEIRSLREAVDRLQRISKPFLDWAGKAERLSFDVPTLPLFVHERLSTKAILETLKGHKRDRQDDLFEMFGDPQHSVTDQILKAYEYPDKWTNRLMLGDSLVVMNSLLQYEGLGGQVQMIYMDPPYGVQFGSNFQPFVRRRNVTDGDDNAMTREPETVKAYRDTWELGLHSYLTYMRDRLLAARELLAPSGSMFVQISDQNLHHVRELMDEVFGAENGVVTIVVQKKGNQKADLIEPVNDYLLWYAKDKPLAKARFHPMFRERAYDDETIEEFGYVELADGTVATVSELAKDNASAGGAAGRGLAELIKQNSGRIFDSKDLTVGGVRKNQSVPFTFNGRVFDPGISRGLCWKHTAQTDDGSPSGMQRLAEAGRLVVAKNSLRYKRYFEDFPFIEISNLWADIGGAKNRIYVVQTNTEVIKRCILLTSNPGDLVLDPTCGSGTTAFVAERWGRRWISIDTSRVPLALARQRLLTATHPYFRLRDPTRGPAGGFVFEAKRNARGDDVGGVVPHVTSTNIANGEPPKQEVLVDRPADDKAITRVTGAFTFEATIPTPIDWDGEDDRSSPSGAAEYRSFVDRMLEVLRRSPVLQLGKNRTLTLSNVRPPAKTLSLSAEAYAAVSELKVTPSLADVYQEGKEKSGKSLPFSSKPVALVFGPENGAVSEKLVYEAAREAHAKSYTQLVVIGFAIQPNARNLVEQCEEAAGIPAVYVQATPDIMMGDLLKTMRSSQIFSVCGLPDIKINRNKDGKFQVELRGFDVFDPSTMETDHLKPDDVPAWFLDSDYNDLCFHVSQAFFPRTAAWDDLRKSLKGQFEDSAWAHLAGTTSAPFERGDNLKIAVKVIDDRGNELMVVKDLKDAE